MGSDLLARPGAGGRALPELDALRGVAIVAVFVQHLGDRFEPLWARGAASLGAAGPWVMTALHHAHWGVDLFFVVSGFSLSLRYLRAFDAGRPPPSAGAFLRRRAARIVPGYAAAIAAAIAAHPGAVLREGFGVALLSHATLLQGYFTPVVLIGAAWSLTTEVHFYLLMPWLAAPILRRRRWLVGLGVVAAAWLARGALHAATLDPGRLSAALELSQRRLVVSRLDQFVLGMLAAAAHVDLLRSRHAERAARAAPAVLGASLVLLVVAFRLDGDRYLSPGGWWPYSLVSIATAGVVLSATMAGERARRWIAPGPLCALGVVSYGVFLYHELMLGLVGARVPMAAGEPTWGRMGWSAALSLGASALLGLASWRWVERPFLDRA